ncbi:hypothetical protein D3C86_1419020 [compost metagenome]
MPTMCPATASAVTSQLAFNASSMPLSDASTLAPAHAVRSLPSAPARSAMAMPVRPANSTIAAKLGESMSEGISASPYGWLAACGMQSRRCPGQSRMASDSTERGAVNRPFLPPNNNI